MRRSSITFAVALSLCLPAVAYAQSKTVTLNGLKADVVVTPNEDLMKGMAGDSKQDVLDMARKATPATIMRPGTTPGSEKAAP